MLPNDLLATVNLGLLKHKAWQARSSGLDKAYKAKKIYTNGNHIEIDIRDRRTLIENVRRRFERARQRDGNAGKAG